MPYITKARAAALERATPADIGGVTGADLNYALCVVIANYVEEEGLSYSTISDVLGAIEGAKFEFLRRIVQPYEQGKLFVAKQEDGDRVDPFSRLVD